jgi:hypothetical protein
VDDLAAAAFLAAAAANAGFQATVTMVVYPALARVRPAHWRQAHDRHSRAIWPLVAVLYAALAATAAWWLVADWSAMTAVAVALGAVPVVVTALVAAPLHRRLVRRDTDSLRRLLVADRVRTAFAVAAVAVAIAAVAG